ncbi:tetratricopeptide (TPR) repeat protein [Pedobacter sp. UYP24]
MKRHILPILLLLIISCKKKQVLTSSSKNNDAYDKAYEFLEKDISDSSFIYFNNAKEQFLKTGDSIKAAGCLINMAIISGDQGDYFGSQEISLSAIKYLDDTDEKQRQLLSSNFNNLGKMANLLKNYNEANDFYLKSIDLTKEKNSKAIYLNNIAINLSDQKQYDSALKYFNQLIEDKNLMQNKRTFSRVLSNISETKWLKNPNYNAAPDFLKALAIRIQEDDKWGQNASYSHLANFYAKKRPDSGLFYAQKMYTVAIKIQSANDQLEALQKLIKLSPSNLSIPYFERYQSLADSVQIARGNAKNQFALVRYETEKSKADNLLLQNDNDYKRYQIFILIAGLVIVVTGGGILYRYRKQRLALQAKNQIHENQLKTSKKVHDVVANGLYRIMSDIQNKPDINREHLLDEVESLYEKSRDISYENIQKDEDIFNKRIQDILTSFENEQLKVYTSGNDPLMWQTISTIIKQELEYIIQELMVNMSKHSQATKVNWIFERLGNQVKITYMDNGCGFDEKVKFKNGLTNTGNRMQSIGGTITFDRNVEKGLKISLSFLVN